jgi:hypothetical protein
MPRKISQQTFCFCDHKKRYFQCKLDDNVSAIHVFIKQIFIAAETAPISPAPR